MKRIIKIVIGVGVAAGTLAVAGLGVVALVYATSSSRKREEEKATNGASATTTTTPGLLPTPSTSRPTLAENSSRPVVPVSGQVEPSEYVPSSIPGAAIFGGVSVYSPPAELVTIDAQGFHPQTLVVRESQQVVFENRSAPILVQKPGVFGSGAAGGEYRQQPIILQLPTGAAYELGPGERHVETMSEGESTFYAWPAYEERPEEPDEAIVRVVRQAQ